MQHSRRLAGTALLVFAAATFAALALTNTPAGNYDVSKIHDYVAASSRVTVIIGALIGMIGAGALLVHVSALRAEMRPGRSRDLVWGAGIVAAAAAVVGWTMAAALPTAYLEGGGNVDLTPAAIYTAAVVAVLMVYGPAMIFTGIALIVAARQLALAPGWWRIATYVAGVCAVASAAFFPFYLFLLYGVVVGLWGLTTGGRRVPASREPVGASIG